VVERGEKGGVQILQRFTLGAPLPSVHLHGTKSIREGKREGWPARVPPSRFCKGRREKKREGERLMNLAKIHFNFEKFKVLIQWWW
jgi:hypothetical protein